MWQPCGTNELTVSRTAYTTLIQDQGTQNPSLDQGRFHQIPSLAERLLTVGGCWVKDSEFSQGRGPLYAAHASAVSPTAMHTLLACGGLSEV